MLHGASGVRSPVGVIARASGGTTLLVLLGLSVLSRPASVDAQETGGSFGASDDDWGSHAGSGSSAHEHAPTAEPSPPRDWPSDRPSDRGAGATSSDWVPSSPEPWRPDLWALARTDRGRPDVLDAERAALADPPVEHGLVFGGTWLCVFALLVALRLRSVWHPRAAVEGPARSFWRRAAPSPAPHAIAHATVTRLSVAYGPDARAPIQRALVEIASTVSPQAKLGRHAAAHRVALLMREHGSEACYATLSSETVPASEGPGVLASRCQDLRARYRTDTVGRVRSAVPDGLVARPVDGPGLVVVSLLIGSRGSASSSPTPRSSAEIQRVLAAMIPRPEDLVGLEVVWSPSEEADRLSSYELEALYPELERFADAREVGAMRCDACGGGYSRELRFCPHCGKPVTA